MHPIVMIRVKKTAYIVASDSCRTIVQLTSQITMEILALELPVRNDSVLIVHL
jgi:hypothetical protein